MRVPEWWPWAGWFGGEKAGASDGQTAGTSARAARWEPSYSDQYGTMLAQGHTRPTPAFGAPTLVWHVGVWPRSVTRKPGASGKPEPCDPQSTYGMKHRPAWLAFTERRREWIGQVNELIAELQHAGRGRTGALSGMTPKQFDPGGAAGEGPASGATGGQSGVLARESIGFTLWWRDGTEPDEAAARAGAIRVRVHVELLTDYATISFFMDVGQQADGTAVYAAKDAVGNRRRRMLQAVADVRGVCERQMTASPTSASGIAPIDAPALPELLGAGEEDTLRDGRNILYVEMWEDFRTEMGVSLAKIAGNRGDVFANFCGLVMETGGLPDPQIPPELAAAIGSKPLPAFKGNFARSGEANAVVKAFWPFIRRITPLADHREFTASGVLHWRAIYITALGAQSQFDAGEERDPAGSDVSEASIVEYGTGEGAYVDSMAEKKSADGEGYNHPVRYLILTKCQPHPRQIGRIVERINSLGTLRLFALKDWSAIRDADPHIRILGQELDGVIHEWGVRKRNIELLKTLEQMRWARNAAPNTFRTSGGVTIYPVPELKQIDDLPKPGGTWLQQVWAAALQLTRPRRARKYRERLVKEAVLDVRHDCLYELTQHMDEQLVQLGALLDDLGRRASGGFHFRLNRSAYYIEEFGILLKTLHIGNIPTWISYEQFVVRGLSPTFDYIASVGKRLALLRGRLQSVIAAIETSALVVQSAATRHNTAELRKIVRVGWTIGGGGLLLVVLRILQALQLLN